MTGNKQSNKSDNVSLDHYDVTTSDNQDVESDIPINNQESDVSSDNQDAESNDQLLIVPAEIEEESLEEKVRKFEQTLETGDDMIYDHDLEQLIACTSQDNGEFEGDDIDCGDEHQHQISQIVDALDSDDDNQNNDDNHDNLSSDSQHNENDELLNLDSDEESSNDDNESNNNEEEYIEVENEEEYIEDESEKSSDDELSNDERTQLLNNQTHLVNITEYQFRQIQRWYHATLFTFTLMCALSSINRDLTGLLVAMGILLSYLLFTQ